MPTVAQEPVTCFVASGFERVAEVFEACLADRPDAGAAACLYVDGQPVVDLWGGQTYGSNSLQLLYSGTKGALAVSIGILVDRGLLDLDEPVASYWPEFAAAGKAAITVRMLMSHQAGLPAVDGGFTLEDCLAHDRLAVRLAQQKPYWDPGTAVGYHGITSGTLGNELVRRVAGRSTGEFFRSEICEPLGLDFWIGLPPNHFGRVVRVQPARNPLVRDQEVAAGPHGDLLALSLPRDLDLLELDAPRVWASDLPSATGVANARSLARMYAACIGPVDGVRLLSPEVLQEITACQADGVDVVNGEPVRFALGFQLPFPRLPYAGEGSFGHDGHNGTFGLAQPALGFAFGFTTDRQPDAGGADPYSLHLVEAALECL